MTRPISPRLHGVLDYLTVAFFAAAPAVFRLPRWADTTCLAMGLGQMAGSMATDYPLGATPAIPFESHGAAEVLVGAGLLAAAASRPVRRNPTVLGLALALGAIYVTVPLLTRYHEEA